MGWVKMDESLLGLPIQIGSDVRVLMAIDLIIKGHGSATVEIADIAEKAGVNPTTARRSIKALVAAGLVEVEHNYRHNSRVASTYRRGGEGPQTRTSGTTDSQGEGLQTRTSGSTDSQGEGAEARRVRVHSAGRKTTDNSQTEQTTTQTTTTPADAGVSGIDFIPLAKGGRSVAEVVASTPKAEPVAKHNPNRRAEACLSCNETVGAGKGTLATNAKGYAQAVHLDGDCPVKATVTIPAYTTTPYVAPTPEDQAERAAINAKLRHFVLERTSA